MGVTLVAESEDRNFRLFQEVLLEVDLIDLEFVCLVVQVLAAY